MTVTIYSESPIDDTMYDQVLDILKHSQCPHDQTINCVSCLQSTLDAMVNRVEDGEIVSHTVRPRPLGLGI